MSSQMGPGQREEGLVAMGPWVGRGADSKEFAPRLFWGPRDRRFGNSRIETDLSARGNPRITIFMEYRFPWSLTGAGTILVE
jgi:hypothetical protein